MPTLNVPLRNFILDGMNTAFDGGTLRLYTGSKPATSNLAPTGTLLASITLPADAFADASAGSIAKNGTWSFTGVGAGDAGWARFSEAGDTGALDANFRRKDATVTETGGGGELTLDNPNITVGQNGSVATYTLAMPAGS